MVFFYTPWLLPLPFPVEIKTFKYSLREKMEIFPFCLIIKYLMLRLFHCWIKKKSRAKGGYKHEGDAEDLGLFACLPSCGRLHYCSNLSLLISVRGHHFPVCDHVTCHGPCATSVCSHLIDARPSHVTWFKKTAQQQVRWVLHLSRSFKIHFSLSPERVCSFSLKLVEQNQAVTWQTFVVVSFWDFWGCYHNTDDWNNLSSLWLPLYHNYT